MNIKLSKYTLVKAAVNRNDNHCHRLVMRRDLKAHTIDDEDGGQIEGSDKKYKIFIQFGVHHISVLCITCNALYSHV